MPRKIICGSHVHLVDITELHGFSDVSLQTMKHVFTLGLFQNQEMFL